jgi:ATP-dependent DNA ligase
MLPSPALEPRAGEHWIHEIKFDGYRTVLVVEDRMARVPFKTGRQRRGSPNQSPRPPL